MTVTNAAAYGCTATFNSSLIGQVVDISVSGCAAGTVDNTYQGSTATNGVIWKTHDFSGFVEPGEVTLKVLFDGTLPAVGTKANLALDFTPLSKTWTWTNAVYTGFDPTANMGAEMTASIKFKLSGVPTVA